MVLMKKETKQKKKKIEKITVFIDGIEVTVPEGTTIMEAADTIGIHIPRLCYHPSLSIEGACRICVVEIEGRKNLVAACAYPVESGLKIKTISPKLRRIRRDIVELILDNHPMDCQTCERDSNCELQRAAYSLGVRYRHFVGERKNYAKDLSSFSVIRDPNKCILCERCVRVCEEVQGVTALANAHRGFKSVVVPAFEENFSDSICVNCGQCINMCPTAAFLEKDNTGDVWKAIDAKDMIVVGQIAPSVRAAIGEAFGLMPGENYEKQCAEAMRMLGFDYVFDTQFGADVTIMEEASEFVQRLKNNEKFPMFTSCCPTWVKFVEHFYPEFLNNLSTAKSPMSMQGALIKTFFAKQLNVPPEKIFNVAIMCCTAKKFEANRPELKDEKGNKYIDAVITTREFAWMIKSAGINFTKLKGTEFDKPLGLSSGAGTIFGTTGGVMEAALRSAAEFITGETLVDIEFKDIRGVEGIRETTITIGSTNLNIAVAHGLDNAHQLIRDIKAGKKQYHFIEVMGCPGGCIGGGGQPYPIPPYLPLSKELLLKRASALYNSDKKKTFRRSHHNPDVIRIYKNFLEAPLSKLSHKLLHTHYVQRHPTGIYKYDVLKEELQLKPHTPEDQPKYQKLIDAVNAYRLADDKYSYLIPLLHKAQELFGYLPKDAMKIISMGVKVPLSSVYGVATFYHFFTLNKRGKYSISICLGTACYVKGAGDVMEKFKELLGIDVGQTTNDGIFTLECTRCIGACGLAPVVLVNEEVFSQVKPEDVKKIIDKYKNLEAAK